MKADVCLILEGTYPYVYGGVSSWIHQLVTAFQDITFSIVHLSATGDVMHTSKYDIPPNIIDFKEAFIHDFTDDRSRTHGLKAEGWAALRKYYSALGNNVPAELERFYEMVVDKRTRRLNIHDIMFSRQGWETVVDFYKKVAPKVSFIDFFWTMRLIHIPILNIFNVDLPDASVYHTVCTGYAGLLASIARHSKKAPLILTEHGIYTYERKIDISRSAWIYSEAEKQMRATRTLGFFKDLWINKFEILSRLTYDSADKVITLCEGNRRLQIEGGADPGKCSVVPNGVYFEAADGLGQRPGTNSIGFAGRVVSIKDVKMLIRAAKIVKEKIGSVKIYIMGERDEEPDYAEECLRLTEMLGLQDNIEFTGVVDLEDYFPLIDVMVLTSISEAQPLSLLEAMSKGIPVVATDVGACREMIMGKDDEDRGIGASGIVTRIGDPHDTANALIRILQDQRLRDDMARAGAERVKRYYTVKEMLQSYREIYGSFLGA